MSLFLAGIAAAAQPPPARPRGPPPPPAPTVSPAPPAPPRVVPASPPSPPAVTYSRRALPHANLGSHVSDEDYPASARRNREEGTTAVRLTVGHDGRVTACQVTRSSGSTSLDHATCRIMRIRARFQPALDAAGRPAQDTFPTRVRWRIPDLPAIRSPTEGAERPRPTGQPSQL